MNKFEPVLQPPRPSKKDQKTPTEEVVDLTKEAVLEEEVGRDISGIRKRPADIEDVTEEAADILEPGELQEDAVVDAFEIHGFKGLNVAATLEMKEERKGSEARNEDNIIADPDTGLVGVLDGLGGEGKAGDGAKASMSAERNIPNFFKTRMAETQSATPDDLQKKLQSLRLTGYKEGTSIIGDAKGEDKKRLAEAIVQQDPEIAKKIIALSEALQQSDKTVEETGGKTTACLSVVHTMADGRTYAIIANVGDSSAYKRRSNGALVPLTRADDLMSYIMENKIVTKDRIKQLRKNPEDTVKIGKKSMTYEKIKKTNTQALGGGGVEPSMSVRELKLGEELLFMTDGVDDFFEDEDKQEINLPQLARAYEGPDTLSKLNNLREQATTYARIKSKINGYKEPDDIAVVSVRTA